MPVNAVSVIDTARIRWPRRFRSGSRRRTSPSWGRQRPARRTRTNARRGGWRTFTNPKFKNQGDCVSYVNHLW